MNLLNRLDGAKGVGIDFLNFVKILTRLKSEFSGTYSLVINQKPVESKKSTFDLANRRFT